MAAGLGPGDEVIVPSLTFVASANAVAYTGATPVLCDVRSVEDPMLSAERAAELVTANTRAVMLVHYGGFSAYSPALETLCDEHGLLVVEDAAHAAGSRQDGLHLGTWGDAGCFSFFSNKNLAVGEGGMLVTNDGELFERVGPLRSHGMTSLTWDRHRGHSYSYDVAAHGFNYRIDEPRAALGSSRLARLDADNDRRRALVERYRELLAAEERVVVPFAGRPVEGASHHLFTVLVEAGARDGVRKTLHARGVQTSLHYPPIHSFSAFQDVRRGELGATEDYASRSITLPLHPLMSDDDVALVVDELRAAL
jgi:dTDP-4-amino-4,6-dideoxygalactose transaminase